jgi:hypothetical protein
MRANYVDDNFSFALDLFLECVATEPSQLSVIAQGS